MTSSNGQPDSDDTAVTSGLTRITFNATGRTVVALDAITKASGDNRTDVINATLRLAATLLTFAHPNGTLHILAPDGTTHVVHMP
ncbi:hypothetical protein [Catellatospora citrea]|uniref:Uncharacterized protein n=1 Tax=Catellatospora citrea TaxID=53366 RepID=A0A8J3KVN4_9ACTN|nr:hypothetical protein [Catellatospora citrea]RKE07919.1 hypothetical protein C8E86_2758 [Catellatospora citrea]GIG02070.1 hypothetical protein Cci01nite_71630 [Catellatospora citrea]